MFQGEKEKKVKCQLLRLPRGENKTQKLLSEDGFGFFPIPCPGPSFSLLAWEQGWSHEAGFSMEAPHGDEHSPRGTCRGSRSTNKTSGEGYGVAAAIKDGVCRSVRGCTHGWAGGDADFWLPPGWYTHTTALANLLCFPG